MIAVSQHMFHFFAHQAGAQRQAAADAFRSSHHVRVHAEIHVGIQFARTAVAGLYFVHHEHDIVFVADGVHAFDEFGSQRVHAAFPLDAFNHNAGHFMGLHQFLHADQIVGRGMDKAGRQRLEQFMVVVLPGSGQGGEGASVEAVPQGDDGIIFRPFFLRRVFAGHLDGAFVGFAAGVAEEHFLHAGFLTEDFCQLHAGFRVIQVGHVLHLAQLVDDRLLPGVVGDAETGDADAGTHVNVLLAVHIHGDAAFAADDFHREPGVGVSYVLVV